MLSNEVLKHYLCSLFRCINTKVVVQNLTYTEVEVKLDVFMIIWLTASEYYNAVNVAS